MKWLEDLLCYFLGPYWPEYLVAKELRKRGWEVYRNFKLYDPKQKQYAEIDILAVSHDGFIVAEIKSYQGDWESRDYWPRPKWLKTKWWKPLKSPVWQVKRARLALINFLLRDYPKIDIKLLKACKTYVYLARGRIINASDPAVQKAWAQMKIEVRPIQDRFLLPVASAPSPLAFIEALHKYQRHFRWRWYYHVLKKLGRLETYIERLDSKWRQST